MGFIPEKLLARLNDAYDNCAKNPEENAMWFGDFVKGLAMMGKSFDAVDQKLKFKTACRFQHKIDEQLRNYLLDEYVGGGARPPPTTADGCHRPQPVTSSDCCRRRRPWIYMAYISIYIAERI